MALHDAATLRHADPRRDGTACAAIYAPYVEGSGCSFEEVAPGAAQFAQRIETTSATHPWIVLEDTAGLIGFAYASPHRTRLAYRWTAEVGIYVDPVRHRSGAGRRLYGALFELMRRQSFHVALAAITIPNDASIGLHRAFGFEPAGVHRQVGWKAGAWRDVSWWQLRLSEPGDGPPPEPLAPQRLDGPSGPPPPGSA